VTVGAPPPSQQPQWSADGRWWWDGQRWIPAQPPAPSRHASNGTGWVVAGGATLAVVLVAAVIGGVVLVQSLTPTGPPHFALQSTQGVNPCDFPSQFWNGGSGTDIEWTLPAHLAPIASCSFTATFKNTAGAGSGHVTFAAQYGPEYMDPQGYWHVRFIKDSSITCPADIPRTAPGAPATVTCSLSAPDANEYMGDYKYTVS
jgi:hypothetical protein